MFWGCFAASATACLESVRGIMKLGVYGDLLEQNVVKCQEVSRVLIDLLVHIEGTSRSLEMVSLSLEMVHAWLPCSL